MLFCEIDEIVKKGSVIECERVRNFYMAETNFVRPSSEKSLKSGSEKKGMRIPRSKF